MLSICEYKLSLRSIRPFLSVVSTMLNTVTFIERGYEPDLLSMILPTFVSSYIPQLIANGIVERFNLDLCCVFLQLIGILLGLMLYNQRIFLRVIGDLPLLSKIFNYLDYATSNENTNSLINWLIVSELTSISIRKMLFKKKSRIRGSEALNLFLCVFTLYMIRTYQWKSKYIIFAVFAVPVLKRIKKIVMGFSAKKELNLHVATIKTEDVEEKKRGRKVKVE